MKFVLFGDWGMITRPMIDFFAFIAPMYEYFILLGDNFYPKGVESFSSEEWKLLDLFPVHSKIYPVLGNHDYEKNPYNQILYTRNMNKKRNWHMPFFYYDKKWTISETQTIHFLFLDTQLIDPEYTISFFSDKDENAKNMRKMSQQFYEKQLQWLDTTISSCQCRWKIVCGHYPVFSSGLHSKSGKTAKVILSLIKKYKIDIYFSGHDHNSEVFEYCIPETGHKCLFVVSGGIAEKRPSRGTIHDNGDSVFSPLLSPRVIITKIFTSPVEGVFELSLPNAHELQLSFLCTQDKATTFYYQKNK